MNENKYQKRKRYAKERRMYDDLRELANLLNSVSPYRTTRNHFQRLKHKIKLASNLDETELFNLFDDLVRGITKLNQMYRVAERTWILSTREDNLIALQLMQKLAFPDVSLMNRSIQIYNELRYIFRGKTFTVEEAYKEISFFIPMSKGSFYRHLSELRYANYLEIVEVKQCNLLIYRVKSAN